MPRSSHGDKYTVSVVRTEEDRGNSIIFYLLFKWTGSNIGIMQKFTSINAVLVTPVFQFDGLDKQTYVIKFIIGLLKNNRN